MNAHAKDLKGQRFGRLVALGPTDKRSQVSQTNGRQGKR